MANEPFKSGCRRLFGKLYRYYRLLYSFIAFVSLTAVLVFQLSVASPLFHFPLLLKLAVAIPFGGTGLWLMCVCITKYFYRLSGVSALKGREEQRLEVTGIHRFVRHPLYLGTLLLITAAFFIFPYLSNFIGYLAVFLYTIIGIRSEERKLVVLFGQDYISYRNRTPMLIPRLG